MKNLMFLLVAGSLLTACGGSNTVSDASTGPMAPAASAATTPETPTPSVRDAFTGNIATLVGTAPEDAEPVALDSSAAGTPEDSEPAPV